jgi:hypothetical protein
MKISHLATKGKYMNIHEKFHIYRIIKKSIQTSDNFSDHTNPICDMLIEAHNNEVPGSRTSHSTSVFLSQHPCSSLKRCKRHT